MADITVPAGIRSNLISLQNTQDLLEQTNRRLATGKKVASAIDNPTNFFAAQGFEDRANGLSARLDGLGTAVQTIKAADNGISTVQGFLSQLKGVVNDALSNTDTNARVELAKQYNELLNQTSQIIDDSSFGGVNLTSGSTTLTVEFNEKIGVSTLDVKGFNVAGSTGYSDGSFSAAVDATAAGGAAGATAFALTFDVGGSDFEGIKAGGTSASAGSNYSVNFADTTSSANTNLESLITQIENVEDALKSQASKLANNLAVVTQREDFTKETINILQEGADKLTLADLNEEGANLLALQTSSQLGTSALSLASQQSQNVLRLIG